MFGREPAPGQGDPGTDGARRAIDEEFERITDAAQAQETTEAMSGFARILTDYRLALIQTGMFDLPETFVLVRDFHNNLLQQNALESYLDLRNRGGDDPQE